MSYDKMKYVSSADSHVSLSNIYARAMWRKIMRTTVKQFDPSIDYEYYLNKFREDFEKKWATLRVSPNIGLSGFVQLGTLGTGAFGCVKLVRSEITGSTYAVKMLSKHKLVTAKQTNSVLNEKRVLQSIKFPNHTWLEFSRKDFTYLYLGMTLVSGGELFIYHRKCGQFREKQACFYAAQIFLALEYLHYLKLLYRDLKPENICIDMNGYIKVTDYGFTKHVPDRTLTLCGTPEYLAPEIIQMKPYGTSADWWAFGVLLYEFVAGNSPFAVHGRDPINMYDKICEGQYKMPQKFSRDLRDLVGRLLQPDLSKRIGVCNHGNSDIKNHIWFSKVDWYGLLNQVIQPPYIPHKKNLQETLNEFDSISLDIEPGGHMYEEEFIEF